MPPPTNIVAINKNIEKYRSAFLYNISFMKIEIKMPVMGVEKKKNKFKVADKSSSWLKYLIKLYNMIFIKIKSTIVIKGLFLI